MTSRSEPIRGEREELVREAERYLAVVEVFAALGADPHATARTRAAHARAREERRLRAARPVEPKPSRSPKR